MARNSKGYVLINAYDFGNNGYRPIRQNYFQNEAD